MLLAISLVGPGSGTNRKDLFYKEGIEHDIRRAMDALWRPNQAERDLCVDGGRTLTVSRSVVGAKEEILNWVDITARSPYSPDGRTGYIAGIGVFFLGSADAGPLFNLLTDGFKNFFSFMNYYAPGKFHGYSLSDMRLDRINLTQDYIDNLSGSIKAGNAPKPVPERCGYLVRPFCDSLASFQEVYAFAQDHGDFSRIIVSADPKVFSRSLLKEIPFLKRGEGANPDLSGRTVPQPNVLPDPLPSAHPPADDPKVSPKAAFSSAAGASLIPFAEKTALNSIDALISLATQQGPDGDLARKSLGTIRAKLNACTFDKGSRR